jgi:PAS domain S-box-containing protein
MNSAQSRRTANPGSPLHTVALAGLIAILSYLCAQLGGALVLRPEMIWPIWPGCAFLVAVLLLVPRKIWPIVMAAGLTGFVLYDLQAGLTLRSTALLILADTVEVLIAALGVSYAFAGVPGLNSVKALAKYSLFAVVLAPVTTAFIGTVALSGDYWLRWKTSFFTEALALLTLTPAILTWVSARQEWTKKPRVYFLEAFALITGLEVLGYIAFAAPGRSSPVLLYSLLPFLLWSALRFGLMGISTSMIVVALLSTWGAVHGRGPFTGSDPLNDVMSLQLFLLFAATPFMVLAVLVEERKQSEQSLRESEKRFRLVADTAPALIWMSDTDKLCTYFNKPWLDFTGRSIESELGNGWADGVHPEDLQRCMDTYTRAFDRREQFKMEYRLRRHDGEYQWVIDIGVPRFNQDGSFIGYIGCGVDVTERKQAEEALKKSEEKFSKAFRQSPIVLTLTSTKDHRYIDVNETFERVTGWRRDEVIGRTPFDIGFWAQPSERVELTNRLLSEGRLRDVETSFRMKDGSVRIGLATGELIELNGEPCMLGAGTDITERKRAEEALERSESNYRMFIEQSSEGIFCQELDLPIPVDLPEEEQVQRILHESYLAECNDALARMYGMSRSTFVGKRLTETVDAKNPVNIELTRDYVRGGYRVVDRESHEVDPQGNAKVFLNSMIGIVENGMLVRTWGIQRDITDRRQAEQARVRAEQALRESEQRLRLATQAGKMYAYEWDVESDKVMRSAEYASVLGSSDQAQHLTRQQVAATVHPDDREKFIAVIADLTPENPTTQISYRVFRTDGSVIWVEKSARAFFDEQGKLLRMIGMVTDITERKQAEEALRDSEARLRLATQAGKMYAYEWDVATDVTVRSEEYANIVGLQDMPINETHHQFSSRVHPDDRVRFSAAIADLTPENPTMRITYRVVRSDGGVIWLEKNGRAFFDVQGRMLRMIGIVADITERKLAEEALARVSRKLIAAQEQERRRIARELHDDIGQRLAMLTIEIGELQQSSFDLPTQVRGRINELKKQTSDIATEIQSLSHELHSAKLEYLGITTAIRGFCKEFGEQQKVEIDFQTHDLPSPLDPDISLCLFRVLQEALNNSAKHSGVRQVEVRLWGTLDEIHLTVSDRGAGFDSEKEKQRESQGLGLISMEERLKLVNGTFSIESQPKRGTTIHARVPLAAETESRRAAG